MASVVSLGKSIIRHPKTASSELSGDRHVLFNAVRAPTWWTDDGAVATSGPRVIHKTRPIYPCNLNELYNKSETLIMSKNSQLTLARYSERLTRSSDT
jgi:hypothetical protein